MSSSPQAVTTIHPVTGADFLAKEHTIAHAGFNRWLVPPAALCIHLCIGMAYGFSVFWLPLTKALGIDKSIACPRDMSWIGKLFATTCEIHWRAPPSSIYLYLIRSDEFPHFPVVGQINHKNRACSPIKGEHR